MMNLPNLTREWSGPVDECADGDTDMGEILMNLTEVMDVQCLENDIRQSGAVRGS